MDLKINLESIYRPSEDLVCRKIQGELIIIPITSGIGDLEDEIYTLNETGEAIWNRLDGKRSLRDVIRDLSSDFLGSFEEIERDVLGLVEELLKRRMLVEVK